MTKQFLYLLFLGFFVLACHGKVTEEPVAPPKPEQEKPPCLTCNYDEESPGGCVTCANEQVSEIYTDVEAKVVSYSLDVANTRISTIFTIRKEDLTLEGNTFAPFQDSVLVPCKKIPIGYDSLGKRVKISGKLMSCKNLICCPNCTASCFGRKFILTQIR